MIRAEYSLPHRIVVKSYQRGCLQPRLPNSLSFHSNDFACPPTPTYAFVMTHVHQRHAANIPIPVHPEPYVFILFTSAPAASSAFLLSSPLPPPPTPSFLPPNNTGGFAFSGVGKFSGLGNTALFNPPRPQLSQSLNRPLGDAISDCSMYRDGNAEMGVSRLLLVLFLFSE